MSSPVRIQIACHDRLVAEAIVEPHMVGAFVKGGGVWERHAAAKDRKGLPVGGAVTQRADKPRQWNVPVGAVISRERQIVARAMDALLTWMDGEERP